MASLSGDSNSNLNSESPIDNEKEEKSENNEEPKDENTSQSESTSSVDLLGTNQPVNICSPISFQNSHKPVFGSSRSILKPSTLFTDANTSSQCVTFGNNTSKTVKLKPSVLANPFVNSETSTTLDSNVSCDEKSDKLPQSEENSSSKEDTKNSAASVPLKFVPLNGPPTTPSVTLAATTSAANTTTSIVSNAVSSTTPNSTSISTEFIFGQNLHERVTIENETAQQPQQLVTQNGTTFSEMLFSSAIKQESSAKQKDGTSHEFSNGNAKTLSDSAKEYEEARSVKRKYEEVAVVTGEEDEQNVLQINCKLFAFDNASSSWAERGRGTLRVNDKETCEGRSSRLVMRLLGNLRVVLNTKIWGDMSVEHVSKKSVRLTAIDNDGQVRIYLVMASPKDSEQLYNVLSTRINKKKLKTLAEESTSSGPAKAE